MRLTLRALLAYLDDVLEPKALRELGARISESPQASSTVARIREVVRRRRIAAPELTGSGSAPDPNLVAEYLDNTLEPQAAPALEKLCLESDMHLAEVASSHQILTAVLGEPVDVPVSTRERMYALVMPAPTVEGAPESASPSTETAAAGARSEVVPPAAGHSAAVAPRPMTPDYLKQSTGKSVMIALLVLVLGGAWGVWVLKEQGLLGGAAPVVVATDSEAPVAEADAAPVAEVVASNGGQPSSLATAGTSTDLATPETGTGTATVAAPNNTLAAVAPEDRMPAEGTADAAVPMPQPPLPAVAPPAEVGLAPQPEPAPPAVGAQAPFPAILYGTPTGVLLIRNPQDNQWIVMPRRTLLHAGDEIACPEPFEAQLQVADPPLTITLWGGTRMQLDSGNEGARLSLKLDRGRIALARGEGGDPELVLDVEVRGQPAQLTLAQDTRCGLEVGLRAPQGRKVDPLLGFPEGGLSIATGSVKVSWQNSPDVEVGASVGWAAWPVLPEPFAAGPRRSLPPWLAPEGTIVTLATRRMNDKFEQEFSLEQPVSVSMPALVGHEVSRISELATYTLGLVDDIPSVVRGLLSKNEEARLAAIYTLRAWLPTAPENAGLLEEEVRRHFPDEEVATIVDLLWGYSLEDGRDPQVSQTLVTLLGHRDLSIRELAIFHIKRLTGRDRDYHANLSESMRNPAWMRWRDHLEANGGVLLK